MRGAACGAFLCLPDGLLLGLLLDIPNGWDATQRAALWMACTATMGAALGGGAGVLIGVVVQRDQRS
jgi:membrane protein YqaA with SNARE-associated domain